MEEIILRVLKYQIHREEKLETGRQKKEVQTKSQQKRSLEPTLSIQQKKGYVPRGS